MQYNRVDKRGGRHIRSEIDIIDVKPVMSRKTSSLHPALFNSQRFMCRPSDPQ